jgi:hypothetical protein
MEPVSIPIRVDWWTMMTGKLATSLRPSRLFLFGLASCGVGTAVAAEHHRSILGTSVLVAGALAVVRLVVMSVASALDHGPRRRFNGTLTLRDEGLELTSAAGTSETHPWSWILSAEKRSDVLRLQLDERGGRFWTRFSLQRLRERGVLDQVVAHLHQAGRLRA